MRRLTPPSGGRSRSGSSGLNVKAMDRKVRRTRDPPLRHFARRAVGRWRQRQLARGDSSISWIERWDAAEVWFFANVRPRETFDYRVTGPA